MPCGLILLSNSAHKHACLSRASWEGLDQWGSLELREKEYVYIHTYCTRMCFGRLPFPTGSASASRPGQRSTGLTNRADDLVLVCAGEYVMQCGMMEDLCAVLSVPLRVAKAPPANPAPQDPP